MQESHLTRAHKTFIVSSHIQQLTQNLIIIEDMRDSKLTDYTKNYPQIVSKKIKATIAIKNIFYPLYTGHRIEHRIALKF